MLLSACRRILIIKLWSLLLSWNMMMKLLLSLCMFSMSSQIWSWCYSRTSIIYTKVLLYLAYSWDYWGRSESTRLMIKLEWWINASSNLTLWVPDGLEVADSHTATRAKDISFLVWRSSRVWLVYFPHFHDRSIFIFVINWTCFGWFNMVLNLGFGTRNF